MRDLVASELVEQIVPGMYLGIIPNYELPFLRFVEDELNRRRLRPKYPNKKIIAKVDKIRLHQRALLHIDKFDYQINRNRARRVLIHREKFGGLLHELIKMKVAKQNNTPWIEMEPWVADAYMIYLSSTLGAIKEINAAPVTNDRNYYSMLGGSNRRTLIKSRDDIRTVLLQSIMPDTINLDIDKVLLFKNQYSKQLKRLRNRIENDCIEIASLSESNERLEKIELLQNTYEEEIVQINEQMKGIWKKTIFISMIPILGSGAALINSISTTSVYGGIGFAASLITAIYRAFEGVKQTQLELNKPLAYAALSRTRVNN